jgi:hypothetical protein
MQLKQNQASDDPFAGLTFAEKPPAVTNSNTRSAAHHRMLDMFAKAGFARSEIIPRGISSALNGYSQGLSMAGA